MTRRSPTTSVRIVPQRIYCLASSFKSVVDPVYVESLIVKSTISPGSKQALGLPLRAGVGDNQVCLCIWNCSIQSMLVLPVLA